MFFIGKESTLEATEKAGGHCDTFYAYPAEDSCIWMGWSSDLDEALEPADVRIALLMTICDSLKIEDGPNGKIHQISYFAIQTLLNSITGTEAMGEGSMGRKRRRQAAKKARGFA